MQLTSNPSSITVKMGFASLNTVNVRVIKAQIPNNIDASFNSFFTKRRLISDTTLIEIMANIGNITPVNIEILFPSPKVSDINEGVHAATPSLSIP